MNPLKQRLQVEPSSPQGLPAGESTPTRRATSVENIPTGSSTWLHVRPDHPQRVGFAYPHASEAQLLVFEAALGFTLPLLLRTLYAQIANCGFGPDAGIQGTLVGYGTCIEEAVCTIAADYVWHC